MIRKLTFTAAMLPLGLWYLLYTMLVAGWGVLRITGAAICKEWRS